MTRKEALAELIAKVEAGGLGNVVINAFDTVEQVKLAIDAWLGSLDAALALHRAVLPGWHWETDGTKIFRVWVQTDEYLYSEAPRGTNDARAWLLAILKALHAQEQEKDQ